MPHVTEIRLQHVEAPSEATASGDDMSSLCMGTPLATVAVLVGIYLAVAGMVFILTSPDAAAAIAPWAYCALHAIPRRPDAAPSGAASFPAHASTNASIHGLMLCASVTGPMCPQSNAAT